MTKGSMAGVGQEDGVKHQGGFVRLLPRVTAAVLAAAALISLAGCQTTQSNGPADKAATASEAIILREGDVVRISFPGSPNLDSTQQIRRDGKIAMSLVGEVTAAGKTPEQLEKDLLDLYASQIVSKQVTVTLVSSSFPVFVTGAVIRPGKVTSDHPITALEAIMESGGFDYTKANLSTVTVIRNEGKGPLKNYQLNLKLALEGKQSTPFYLKPGDIIYVPEKFSWF